jgi:hypothetical protein
MGMSSRNIPDSNSDVSDDLSFESLSLRVAELENILCNQDKLLCKVFCENKKLNLQLESSYSEIASLWSLHYDMVNYADLWLVHSHVESLLDDARLELRELKTHSLLLGACTSCPLLRSDLRLLPLRLKILSTNLIILLATTFYPLHAKCVALFRVSFSMLPNEFFDFLPHSNSRALPCTSSHALSHFSHGPNHCAYGFGSR